MPYHSTLADTFALLYEPLSLVAHISEYVEIITTLLRARRMDTHGLVTSCFRRTVACEVRCVMIAIRSCGV